MLTRAAQTELRSGGKDETRTIENKINQQRNEKINCHGAALLASCDGGAPKANLKTEVDSLSYEIGLSNSRGVKEYLSQRLGVDTAYLDEFIKGVKEGAQAGEDKKKAARYAGI